MPRRTAQSDCQRDQELLSQVPNVSREQVERYLAAIKRKREEETGSGGSSDLAAAASPSDLAASLSDLAPAAFPSDLAGNMLS